MASESFRYLVLDIKEPFNFCVGTKENTRGTRTSFLENLKLGTDLLLTYDDWSEEPVYLLPLQLLKFKTETEN